MILMPFAFVLAVIGIGEMAWKAGSDTRAILGTILRVTLVTGLLVAYPTMMHAGKDAFLSIRKDFVQHGENRMLDAFDARVTNPPQAWDVGSHILYGLVSGLQGVGRLAMIILRFFQEFAIAGLVATSPLLIGFLFLSYTQTFGVQFGITSLTVLLWWIGIALVDMVLYAVSEAMYARFTFGAFNMSPDGGMVVESWPLVLLAISVFSVITFIFYLSVPFATAALMRGANGLSAAFTGGIGMAMTGAGLATVGLPMLARAGAGAAGGQSAESSGGSGGDAGGDLPLPPGVVSSSVSSGGTPPSPSPAVPVSANSNTAANPDNPAIVAHQTAPDAFAVVDSDRGTVSHHRGSITTPHAVQAAFNTHSAKAQALPADSPLITKTV